MKYLKNSKLFYALVLALIIGLIIMVYYNLPFLFSPIESLISAVLLPVMLAIFIYYMFLPVYNFISKRIKNKAICLALTFLFIIGVIVLLFIIIVPSLVGQTRSFIAGIPGLLQNTLFAIDGILIELGISSSDIYAIFEEINLSISKLLDTTVRTITTSIGSIVSNTITFIIALFTFPLILFYLFKDGSEFRKNLVGLFPDKYKDLADEVLKTAHKSAHNYIGSRLVVVLFMTVSSYILYSLLGLENALFLAIFNGLLDIIPYFGPWIGAAPAFFSAIFDSPIKALILVVTIMVIQQVESSIVTPAAMGYGLKLHPVTTVILVLFAGEFAGIVGMIFILPIYAIIRNSVRVIIDYKNNKIEDKPTSGSQEKKEEVLE